jgi:Tol biopolymer transport system component
MTSPASANGRSAGLPDLIPRETLFGNPERAGPQISPDGTRLAYLAPVEGVLNVWVGAVGGDAFTPVTHDTDRGVRVFFWSHDNRHLMYLQDKGGDENWWLYKVDLEDGREFDLTPYDRVQVQVVAHRKHHPNDVLIGMNKDDEHLHDVYHLDLATNALTLIEKNPGES